MNAQEGIDKYPSFSHAEVRAQRCFSWGKGHGLSCRASRHLSADLPWLQSRVQDLGSRKGLLPAGTPTSKASLQAFCMQYCWSSAAAWETLILSTAASSFSCSTRRCMVLRLPADDMTGTGRNGTALRGSARLGSARLCKKKSHSAVTLLHFSLEQ